MKPFVPAVVALVVGILAGAWQPRGELLALRAEADELRAAAKKPCRDGSVTADRLRSILRAEAPLARAASGDDEPETPDAPSPPEDADGPAAPPPAEDGAPATPEAMQESLRAAMDARRAQARAALAEQGDLDEAQLAEVDRITAHMNDQLEAEVDRFVDEAVLGGEMGRRDIMDFAAESLDIVIAADDAMRKALPAEVYEDADDAAVDPLSYLEGGTLDALVRLEGVQGPG